MIEKINTLKKHAEELRFGIVSELRIIYPVEQCEDFEEKGLTVDCAGEGELQLLDSIHSNQVMFDDCDLSELLKILDVICVWGPVFMLKVVASGS